MTRKHCSTCKILRVTIFKMKLIIALPMAITMDMASQDLYKSNFFNYKNFKVYQTTFL